MRSGTGRFYFSHHLCYINLCRSRRCFRRGVYRLSWHVCSTRCSNFAQSHLGFLTLHPYLSLCSRRQCRCHRHLPGALSLPFYLLGSELAFNYFRLIISLLRFYRAFYLEPYFLFILEFSSALIY